MTTKLVQFTFEGSGRTVAIEPVSPIVVSDLRRRYPRPQPPLTEIARPNGGTAKVADEEDVEYLRAIEAWQMDLEARIRRLYVTLGVKHRLTDDEKAEVAAFRASMLEADPDAQLDANDLVVYVQYICIKTASDYTSFVAAATGGPSSPKSPSSSTNGKSEQTASTSGTILSDDPASPTR
jgi:hypothetical protein